MQLVGLMAYQSDRYLSSFMGNGENPTARPKLANCISAYGWAIGVTSVAALAR